MKKKKNKKKKKTPSPVDKDHIDWGNKTTQILTFIRPRKTA
jgi:hypothetical protein|tara:strand:- start:1018 stop:1140 length:123 start_codon:yes stop_codon:yes gene_type:complete